MALNLGDTGSPKTRSPAAGAKYLLKRARRRERERAESKPWIGFHRWKELNNAPWSSAWDFGGWFVFLLVLPLIPFIIYYWVILVLFSGLAIFIGESNFERVVGALFFVISTSPIWYYFWDKSYDYGAGEPLSPKKREAYRKKKREKAAAK